MNQSYDGSSFVRSSDPSTFGDSRNLYGNVNKIIIDGDKFNKTH